MVIRLAYLFDMNKKPPDQLIAMLQDRCLIARSFDCAKCRKAMSLEISEQLLDKYRWRCKTCRATRFKYSGNLNVPHIQQSIGTIFVVKYALRLCWKKVDKLEVREQLLRSMKRNSVNENIIEENTLKGNGYLVVLREIVIDLFLATVNERSSATLVPLIKKFIAPGTTIISDSWKAYDALGAEGYTDLTVNHSLNFKDSDTGTNAIEGLLACVKRRLPDCNRGKDMFFSYLAEFMYRRLRAAVPDLFEVFLQDIAKIYRPPSSDADIVEGTAGASGNGN